MDPFSEGSIVIPVRDITMSVTCFVAAVSWIGDEGELEP
jgi:hypothetical protein